MAESKYSVSWNAYQKSICNGLSSLQQRGEFVDMTLAADGHHVKAHQMVLSLVSPYIRDLISSASCPHPVIFLNRVSYQTLESILQYAYTGEVVVSTDRIQEFLNACKELHIRGLEECMNYLDSAKSEEPSHSSPGERDTTSHVVPKKRDRSTVQDNPLFEVSVPTYDDDDTPADFSLDFDNDDDMKSPMDNSEQQQSTAKIVKNEPTSYIGDKTGTTLQYTVSNMGTLQIVLNRYLYCLRNVKKNGERVWKCINFCKGMCLARIVVKDNKVVKRACAHNHPYHDAQILKRLRNRNMFTTMNEVEEAINIKKKQSTDTKTNTPTKTKDTKDKQDDTLSD